MSAPPFEPPRTRDILDSVMGAIASLVYHAQRDPRWRDITLGFNALGSAFTIGNYGCLISCLAALCGVTPDVLNLWGKSLRLFAEGSGLAKTFDPQKWSSASPWRLIRATTQYKFDAFPQADYDALIAHLRAGGVAILEVQWPGSRGQHFVMAIGVVETSHGGTQIVIADPEREGQIELLPAFYGAWPIALVRAAHYTTDPATRALGEVDDNPYQVVASNVLE